MLKINKLPATAGITKLMNQIVAVANPIPRLFALNTLSSCKLTSPRNPNSAIAKLGIMASTRKMTLTAAKLFTQSTCTLNSLKTKKY